MLFQLFATGVADAGGKFASGIVDTGGKFATGGAPWLRKFFIKGAWRRCFMKKKSHDTVPLRLVWVYGTALLYT